MKNNRIWLMGLSFVLSAILLAACSVTAALNDNEGEISLKSIDTSVPEYSLESSSDESDPEEPVQSSVTEASKAPELTDIKLSRETLTLYTGRTYRIGVSFEPKEATDRSFVWRVEDTRIIDVSPDGTITAKKTGTTTLTAKKGDIVSECVVTVKDNPDIALHDPVDPKWFDDAVFIGDSVTGVLCMMAEGGGLGDAEFVYSIGLGYHNCLWDLNDPYNVHPVYNGTTVTLDEGVRLTGKKKVFIMMGLNDIGTYSNESTVEAAKKLTDRILAKVPDAQIYIEGTTYLVASMNGKDGVYNKDIADFNTKLKAFCEANGFIFLNTPSMWDDGDGNMDEAFCEDITYMGQHPNGPGCNVWMDYLRTHVDQDAAKAPKPEETSEQTSSKPDESSKQTSSKPDESSKQTSSKPEETSKQTSSKPEESSKQTSSKPEESSKQTSSKPEESSKQSSSKPEETSKQSSSKPEETSKQTSSKPEESSKQASSKPEQTSKTGA